jgi:hypothetical protein
MEAFEGTVRRSQLACCPFKDYAETWPKAEDITHPICILHWLLVLYNPQKSTLHNTPESKTASCHAPQIANSMSRTESLFSTTIVQVNLKHTSNCQIVHKLYKLQIVLFKPVFTSKPMKSCCQSSKHSTTEQCKHACANVQNCMNVKLPCLSSYPLRHPTDLLHSNYSKNC